METEIWETNKLLLFILFVIPGFISIKIFELTTPGDHKASGTQAIDAIAYSCINYGLLFVPIYLVETGNLRTDHTTIYGTFYFFVLFIAPILWTLAWRWLRKCEVFQKGAPHPTGKPWDFVFSGRKWYWIILTLGDGRKIAGKYGRNSFASSAPNQEQIYLEEEWLLNSDGGFERAKERTAGVIVTSEIISIELFNFTKEE